MELLTNTIRGARQKSYWLSRNVHYLRKTGNAYLNDEFSRDFVVGENGKAEKNKPCFLQFCVPIEEQD
jgi:hypothetical protein